MSYKKICILSIFLVFIFSVVYHNIYVYFPNVITSIFFPVNESIFEHMKLIYLSYLSTSFIEYILMKNNNLDTRNLKFCTIFSIIFNILILLIIYTIVYVLYSHNTFITLLIYFITIVITKLISYKILASNKNLYINNNLFLSIIILMLLILLYFTYNPIKNILFIDYKNKKIGLNNYYI